MSFRGDKNIHYFDYGDVFINVYVCQYIGQTVQTVYPKHKIYCLPIILQKKKKLEFATFLLLPPSWWEKSSGFLQ